VRAAGLRGPAGPRWRAAGAGRSVRELLRQVRTASGPPSAVDLAPALVAAQFDAVLNAVFGVPINNHRASLGVPPVEDVRH
jgi:hypothetical protein